MGRLFHDQKNRIQHTRTQILDTLRLPTELVSGECVLHMSGNHEIFIENYRGILECSENTVWISTKNLRLCIQGRDLSVAYYDNDEMKVIGTIEHISFTE